jgi:hypothetical protein
VTVPFVVGGEVMSLVVVGGGGGGVVGAVVPFGQQVPSLMHLSSQRSRDLAEKRRRKQQKSTDTDKTSKKKAFLLTFVSFDFPVEPDSACGSRRIRRLAPLLSQRNVRILNAVRLIHLLRLGEPDDAPVAVAVDVIRAVLGKRAIDHFLPRLSRKSFDL